MHICKGYKTVTKTAKGDDFINRFVIKLTAAALALIISVSGSVSAYAFDLGSIFDGLIPTQQSEQEEKARIPQTAEFETREGFSVTAEDVTTDGARLVWNYGEVVLSYTICKFNIITGRWEEYASSTEPSLELSGLEEDTDYRFSIFNSVNMEPLGEVSFTTAVKAASVAVTRVNSDSVVLRVRKTDSVSTPVLYKSTDNENFTRVGEISEESYIDTDVKGDTVYYYRVSCVIRRGYRINESKLSKTVTAHTLKAFGLPAVSGETKTYAFYTAVTARRSPQYRLLHSADCYTDPETGIRMVDGYYCIALGSYYGTRIGSKYRITLQDGDEIKELNCILCDQKANRHTDGRHQYAMQNRDIMEFYIEKSKLPRGIRGNYGTLKQFRGRIVKIEGYPEE